jgi:hypothetical protein
MYGYIPHIIQSVGTSEFTGVQEFADNAHNMVMRAHNSLIEAHVEQTHYANSRHQRDDSWLTTGKNTYLSTKNLNLPKAQARKLMPKYIGPYKILSCNWNSSHYTRELPNELLK